MDTVGIICCQRTHIKDLTSTPTAGTLSPPDVRDCPHSRKRYSLLIMNATGLGRIDHRLSGTDAETYPDLDGDERTTLDQFLDHYRHRALARLTRLSDRQARTRSLPATSLTAAGVVKHLAHMEDHWFTARVGGGELPEPWASAPFSSQPDWDFESAANDTVEEIAELYRTACQRSRDVVRRLPSLDTTAPRPSFGKGAVTLRWVMVHMLEETACHVGHLDLLTDPISEETAR